MSIDEIEATVLELSPSDRARLAERLLESLDQLCDEENEKPWAEEAIRRDHQWDEDPTSGRDAAEVTRDALANLT